MPELPDLHVFSENLKKRILGRDIVSVTIYNPQKIAGPAEFCEKLAHTHIEDIIREGKELHFLLANKNSFGVHLMLNGKFYIRAGTGADAINGKIAALCFENGEAFVIADIQGLCRVTLNPKPSGVPDALSPKFTFEYFSGVLRKNARNNIKAVLIDQKLVRGIGNAYADEILWKADISPESVAGKIPEEKARELFDAIPWILNDAIQNIMSIAPDIINGEERSFLRVHNSRKQSAPGGCRIIKKTVASKITYFTEKQKLYV